MGDFGIATDPGSVEIRSGSQKVVFRRSPPNRTFLFGTYVSGGNHWTMVSADDNVLVQGPSFNLAPTSYEVVRSDSNRLAVLFRGKKENVKGLDNKTLTYDWDALVETRAEDPWIHFKTRMHLPRQMVLDASEGGEPNVLLDLGPLPPYERGHFEWFKTEIPNPTVSCHGTPGNDFPGLYFWDEFRKAEIIMFFNIEAMNWMSSPSFRRFLRYRCSLLRDYKSRRYKVGLWATSLGGEEFPAGDQVFEYWLYEKPRSQGRTEQDAIVEMTFNTLPLIPPTPSWPKKATSWADFSERCLKDCTTKDWSWIEVEGLEGFRSYVKGTSRAWQDVFPERDLMQASKPSLFETLDVLHPLLLYSRLPPNDRWADLVEKLSSTVERSYQKRKLSGNAIDVWPYLYTLNRLWWFAFLTKNDKMLNAVVEDMSQSIKLAKNVGYVFPLFFDSETMDKSISGTNVGNAGLYAYNMILAYAVTRDPTMLEEAKAALTVMYHAPADKLFHEPIELGFGALASSLVRDFAGGEEPLRIMKYLLGQELRMFYWYRENSIPPSEHYDTRGMVQACASMLYPALFENVICILPWTLIFKSWEPDEPLLRMVNLQRVHNFFMFPACLPEQAKLKHNDP